jgi:hypothetical protein
VAGHGSGGGDRRRDEVGARKILSRPSASACFFTWWLPGTTIVRFTVTCLPSSTAAAARRSSIRLLVQLPMNTVSTMMSRMRWPAVRPMYSSARAMESRAVGSVWSSGEGTTSSIEATCPGLVPQVICGRIVAASSTTSLSHVAPSSVRSVRQSSSAASHALPFGACSRPSR